MNKHITISTTIKKKILSVAIAAIFGGMLYINLMSAQSTPVNAYPAVLANSTKAEEIVEQPSQNVLFITTHEQVQDKPLIGLQKVANDTKPKIEDIYADPEKVAKLEKYLRRRGSPLADYAQYIVLKADEYGIDYRLVASISIVESSGCLHTYRPNNCWGWGGQEGAATFASLEQGIDTVSRGMARYYANGATTPYAMESSYCPPCTTWGAKVSSVMSAIEAS